MQSIETPARNRYKPTLLWGMLLAPLVLLVFIVRHLNIFDEGFIIIEMDDVYGDVEERLLIAPWDRHPNRVGHQLLADRFFEELMKKDSVVGLR